MAGHSGRLSFSVDFVAAPDGTKVPVVSTPSLSGGGNGKVVAAAAATYGPEALLMRGWNADIRKGTILNAYVNGNHEISTANLSIRPSYTSGPAEAPAVGSPTAKLQHRPDPPAPVPPTIVLLDPSVSKSGDTVKTAASTVTFHGTVTDPTGLPAVTINGSPAPLLASGPHSADFNSGPIRLTVGNNPFEVVATNGANLRSAITFTVVYDPKVPEAPVLSPHPVPRGLSKQDIISLLTGQVSSSRVVDIVNEKGISFTPSADDIRSIRAAGGGDDLANALSNARIHRAP